MAEDERAQIDAARARTGFAGPIPGAGEALRLVLRHGNFSGIRTRLQLGIPLSPEELAEIDKLESGQRQRTGPKDPTIDAAETVICWRWLIERAEWTGTNAASLLAEIMGTTPEAIRGRIKRAQGLSRNFADLAFDVHAKRGAVPALLRHRTLAGHCATCRKVRCRCDPAPRPAFADTPEGAQVAALAAFWRARR